MISKRNVISILPHLVAISAFVVYEISIVYAMGITIPLWTHAPYYVCNLLLFYWVAYVIAPFWHKVKWITVSATCFALIIHFLLYLTVDTWVDNKFSFHTPMRILIVKSLYRSFYVAAIGFVFWNIKTSLIQAKEIRDLKITGLQRDITEMKIENALLQAQINPHLLFNALNLIYSSLNKSHPKEAHALTLLSEIMKFSLGNVQPDGTVSLSEELENIKSYIDLNQVLNNDNLNIRYNVAIETFDPDILIPPVILTNFVQDLFKHGRLDDPAHPANIFIVGRTDNSVLFHLDNEIANSSNHEGLGIGMENSRARLEKFFGNKHSLAIKKTENHFSLDLNIHL